MFPDVGEGSVFWQAPEPPPPLTELIVTSSQIGKIGAAVEACGLLKLFLGYCYFPQISF